MLTMIDYFRNKLGYPYEYKSPKVVVVGGGVGGITVSAQLKRAGMLHRLMIK